MTENTIHFPEVTVGDVVVDKATCHSALATLRRRVFEADASFEKARRERKYAREALKSMEKFLRSSVSEEQARRGAGAILFWAKS